MNIICKLLDNVIAIVLYKLNLFATFLDTINHESQLSVLTHLNRK